MEKFVDEMKKNENDYVCSMSENLAPTLMEGESALLVVDFYRNQDGYVYTNITFKMISVVGESSFVLGSDVSIDALDATLKNMMGMFESL